MPNSTDTVAFVRDIETAAQELATAVAAEQTLEDARVHSKLAAIERIMRADNVLTGKPHSFSSAEAVVNTDAEYQTYLERQRDAVRARILAKGRYDAAIAAARLAASVE
jgi:hypothetical protein